LFHAVRRPLKELKKVTVKVVILGSLLKRTKVKGF
jgi:hypothetical protein